jgi:hypothetical protein
MIKTFANKFIEEGDVVEEKLRELLSKDQLFAYGDLVRLVVEVLDTEDLDPERIHTIDDGDYQGTLLFIIARKGYQPDMYHSVKVYYGSCTVCDTLQSILSEDYRASDFAMQQAVDDLKTLCLHIVQDLKLM